MGRARGWFISKPKVSMRDCRVTRWRGEDRTCTDSGVPAMSLSGVAPEFASRITYEAREVPAKDGASRLSRAISTDNGEDDEHRLLYVSRLRGTMKRNLLQLTT